MFAGDEVTLACEGDERNGQTATVVYVQHLLGQILPCVRVRFADGVECFVSPRNLAGV